MQDQSLDLEEEEMEPTGAHSYFPRCSWREQADWQTAGRRKPAVIRNRLRGTSAERNEKSPSSGELWGSVLRTTLTFTERAGGRDSQTLVNRRIRSTA